MSRRPASLLGIVALVAGALSAAPSAERELAWAPVPSAERRHGEVRVLRRGEAAVVQTVLSSKVLRQVLGRIAEKERRNWPAGAPGHDDAERYVAALAEAGRSAGTTAADGGAADRRRTLLIEFVLTPTEAYVTFAAPEVAADPDGGRLRVGAVRPVFRLDPSRSYVERNMRLIVEDSLGRSSEDAEALIGEAENP